MQKDVDPRFPRCSKKKTFSSAMLFTGDPIGRGLLWRVLLIIGLTGLLTFLGGTTLLGHSPVANAQADFQGNCPNGWHIDGDTGSGCRPNGFCDSGSHLVGVTTENGVRMTHCVVGSNCPAGTWQDPDSVQCLPMNQKCGSASWYDPNHGYCVVPDPQGYLRGNWP